MWPGFLRADCSLTCPEQTPTWVTNQSCCMREGGKTWRFSGVRDDWATDVSTPLVESMPESRREFETQRKGEHAAGPGRLVYTFEFKFLIPPSNMRFSISNTSVLRPFGSARLRVSS